MRAQEFLTEKVSSKVFHYTEIQHAYKILNTKTFRLSAAGGSESDRDHQKGKLYFLSTARSPSADYAASQGGTHGAVFNLNGDWFNQRHKGAPVDYWDRSWWDSASNRRVYGGRTSEQEDRVLSDKPTIKMGDDMPVVIESIHLLVDPTNKQFASYFGGTLRGILLEAKKNRIPIYIYDDKSSWLIQNTRKTIPMSALHPALGAKRPAPYVSRSSMVRDNFEIYRELFYKNSKEQLSKNARDELYNIFQYGDRGKVLDNDIHNYRKDASPGLDKLMDIFKKVGARSGDQYVAWLQDKWKPILYPHANRRQAQYES